MQIRRVIAHDGGNFLVYDELQYREAEGQPWTGVPIVNHRDALVADIAEGLIRIEEACPFAHPSDREHLAEEVAQRRAEMEAAASETAS